MDDLGSQVRYGYSYARKSRRPERMLWAAFFRYKNLHEQAVAKIQSIHA